MPSRFVPEPELRHDQPSRTGIVLCNLGTPDAPTAAAVRPYLAQFLSDDRVVEIPKLAWWPILHGIILRTRPAKSAAKYATIWHEKDGSPLLHWTQRQATLLRGWLGEAGHQLTVLPAMRYGQPSIASQLDALKQQGVNRILILPLYPQYSGTTTASVFDAVYDWAKTQRHIPELRFVNRYHDHAAYIDALAQRIEAHWRGHGRGEKLVMSFHGVPERTLHLGDPYHCESHKTARLLAERLKLNPDQYLVTFQSRFGKAKWLEPYTEPSLIALAKAGTQRVDVVCPGFTSDCLETLEEINQEAREAFLHAGGQQFEYIACLNDSAPWIDALSTIAQQHLAGWPTQREDDEALKTRLQRAKDMGAAR
ncbi:ferrochelatase [Comamonas sp. lk]|uniref:ferrochelatase n=1 Tax=Comamonas sp. lk TaxID=2201272 RepID=UPI000EAD0870|nr:ferrochelatase [Comamonas sp. lk]